MQPSEPRSASARPTPSARNSTVSSRPTSSFCCPRCAASSTRSFSPSSAPTGRRSCARSRSTRRGTRTQPFKGEEQIEKTLTTDPLKLYLDVEAEFGAIRDRAEALLWPANQDEARWTDVVDRYAEQAGMPWLPPRGLDHVKSLALSRGLWEDLGNGYISKRPKRKLTSVQVVADGLPDDTGRVRLRFSALNAGPAPARPLRGKGRGHGREPAAYRLHVRNCGAAGQLPRG